MNNVIAFLVIIAFYVCAQLISETYFPNSLFFAGWMAGSMAMIINEVMPK